MTTQRPPGPRGHFLLGNMREFQNDSLNWLMKMATYGDITYMRFGPFPLYFVNHPDFVHELLVTKANKFYKSRVIKTALADISGNNVFTGDGDFWKRERKLMQPAFHHQRIGAYADTMVDYAHQMMANWRDGETLPIDHEMTTLTMQIVVKTLFDAEVTDDAYEAGEAMTALFEGANKRLSKLIPTPSWIPTHDNRKVHRAVKHIHSIIQPIIEQRRRENIDRGDLLSMLLLAQEGDSGLSDEQVRNEAITLFGPGHETTALSLTWTLYLLSQNPDCAQRLHAEVDGVLGDRRATLYDLKQLPYTEMIIKEAMRLYPPAWAFSREAVEPTDIGGYRIKKGVNVMVAPWTLHRDERWFPNAGQFNPERFAPENEARLPKYAYIPFGAGPRICIGNAFAMMEARLVLASIAQHFDLSLAEGQIVEPERVFTLRPKFGMKMVARQRQPQAEPVR